MSDKIALIDMDGTLFDRVLVDDWPPYIEDWLKHRSRGLVMMPLGSLSGTEL
jgi:hypothetical protein